MSHGPHAQGSAADPNLTPLLDLVLQLLMFFMICADFKRADRQNPTVNLPVSQSAVPRSSSAKEVINVNLRAYRDQDYERTLDPGDWNDVKRFFRESEVKRARENGQQVPSLVVPARHARKPMTMDVFADWLRDVVRTKDARDAELAQKDKKYKPTELVVNIRAEDAIQYEHVFKLRELCQQSGVKTVTISVKTKNRGG